MNADFKARVDAWIASHNGGRYDTDGFPSGQPYQCVDLAQVFNTDLVGGPRFTGNAKDIFGQDGGQYDSIGNTPEFVPQSGDIAVFNGNVGGGYGHICICTGEGDRNYFVSLDQNWSQPAATITRHNYNNVIGFMRAKVSVAVTPSADNEGVVQGDHFRAHTEPKLAAPVPWYYDDQERITLLERTHGDMVVGKWGNTDWWYRTDKGWVSDGFVLTNQTPANVPDYVPPTHAPDTPAYSPRPSNGQFIIDVSSFQGSIDFAALKSAIDGIIIRAGHSGKSLGGGDHNTDTYLQPNRDKARDNGIPIGYYWYAYPAIDAKQAASDFVASCNNLLPGESLWLDLEEAFDGDVGAWANDFMTEVERLSGRACHLYTYQNYAANHDLSKAVRGQRKLWLANYNGNPGVTPDLPGLPKPVMHQYASDGRLPGIGGKVDLNVLLTGTLADLAIVMPPSVTPPEWPVANGYNQDDRNLLLEIRQLIQWIVDRIKSIFK